MKKGGLKHKVSKIKNEHLIILKAISEVLPQFTRVEDLNERKFNRGHKYSYVYPDLTTTEMVKVLSVYTGISRLRVRQCITFLRLNDYIEFREKEYCRIIKKVDFKEIVLVPEYFKIAAKSKGLNWTELNQKVLDYIERRKRQFEHVKEESEISDEFLDDFRKHGMTVEEEKEIRINRYKWEDCDPYFYEKQSTIATNCRCSIGTVKDTLKKLRILFGRKISFKDTPVEKVRRVYYSNSYRIELPDRKDWKSILLKGLNDLWESVVKGGYEKTRKFIERVKGIIWRRQDREGCDFERISKHEFDNMELEEYPDIPDEEQTDEERFAFIEELIEQRIRQCEERKRKKGQSLDMVFNL